MSRNDRGNCGFKGGKVTAPPTRATRRLARSRCSSDRQRVRSVSKFLTPEARKTFIQGNLALEGLLKGCTTTPDTEKGAIPIAASGKIKVVSVDYRMGPEHQFPAASQDVAAVYRAFLKQYKPQNVGIYGCSAGGVLTAQSLPWFQKEGLPTPGAAGMFCEGLGHAFFFDPELPQSREMYAVTVKFFNKHLGRE